MSLNSYIRKAMPFGVVTWLDRKRAIHADNQSRTEFYQRWLDSGDLVFDVGANVGNRALAFQQIGCKVIAFEPQPECCKRLGRFARGQNAITIEQCAVGSAAGTSQLTRSRKRDVLATLSPTFAKKLRKAGDLREARTLKY